MTRETGEGAKRSFLTIDGMICSLNENRENFTRQELVSYIVSAMTALGRDTYNDDIDDMDTPDDNDDNDHHLEPDVTISGSNYNHDTPAHLIEAVKSSVTHNLSCRLPPMVCDILTPLILSYIGLMVDRTPGRVPADIMGMLDTLVTLLPGND